MKSKVQAGTLPMTMGDLYDLLMYDIEPDLLRANISKVMKKRKGENKEQLRERYMHYAECIETLKERFEKCNTELESRLKKVYKEKMESIKQSFGADDAAALDQLTHEIEDLSS